MCFLAGGMTFQEQQFNPLANKVSSSLLFLACIGIIVPTTAKSMYGPEVMDKEAIANLSHCIAVLLIIM